MWGWDSLYEKHNRNYHWLKHLQFESSVRPWTCIFICLGRTSEDKITQCHGNPSWNLEPVFFLWHCLLTRTCPAGCQVNGAISTFAYTYPGCRQSEAPTLCVAPLCSGWTWPVDSVTGHSPAPSGTVSGSKTTPHWSLPRAALLAHPPQTLWGGVNTQPEAPAADEGCSESPPVSQQCTEHLKLMAELEWSSFTLTLRLPTIQAHIRSRPKAKWNVPLVC